MLKSTNLHQQNVKKVLLVVTGSISAFKAIHLASQLAQRGIQVDTVMTPSAKKFVTKLSFSAVTKGQVLSSLWDSRSDHVMDHLGLSKSADLILVYPATASFLNRIASGMGSTLAEALFLGLDWNRRETMNKVWIYPAMNTRMWNHPITQRSVKWIESYGARILPGEDGSLACGELGAGRLKEPLDALTEIELFFSNKRPLNPENAQSFEANTKMSVLVTGGGTEDPIDQVRVITNTGSGQTAIDLAAALVAQGARVKLLLAQKALPKVSEELKEATHCESFRTADDLSQLCQRELSQNSYTTVIHSAAVSDFKISKKVQNEREISGSSGKIDSSTSLTLHLTPREKILSSFKSWSKNKDLKVIAFKLVTESLEDLDASFQKRIAQYPSDYLFLNSLKDVVGKRHAGVFYALKPRLKECWKVSQKSDLVSRMTESCRRGTLGEKSL